MAVDNAVYSITPGLAANISHIVYDAAAGLGGIEYNDRPQQGIEFTDPSPYQSQFNQWLTAAAADNPPLQLAQAIAVKTSLLAAIYNGKRNNLTATSSLAAWAVNVSGANSGNGAAPSNGATVNGSFTVNGLVASITVTSGQQQSITLDSQAVNGGKYYWEQSIASGDHNPQQIGICAAGTITSQSCANYSTGWSYYVTGGKVHTGSLVSYGANWGNPPVVIGVALDLVNDAIWFSLNGVWQNGATATEIANGITTHAAFTGLTGSYYPFMCSDPGAGSSLVRVTLSVNPPFNYTPPTGFGGVAGGTFSGSDLATITLNAQVAVAAPPITVYDINGNAITCGLSGVQTLLSTISNQRGLLASSYNSKLVGLNACATIAAVIAYDVTAGW